MHKNKDGKVTASLTEVKNRTGDIFALVDEFGEVYLTSYNKVRYKITKTDIASFIELSEGVSKAERKESVKPEKKAAPRRPSPALKQEVVEEPVAKVEPEEVKEDSVISKISKIIPWDRNSSKETDFANNSRSPLVSN
ncbi:MAG: hypothetical protein ACMG57_03070 [Candidatus Dojkabacteria bacterium]